MKNSNVNKTIYFLDKKKEIENQKNETHIENIKTKKIIKNETNIISLSSYKREKFKKNYINSKKIYAKNHKKISFLIAIAVLFTIILAITFINQQFSKKTASNSFVTQQSQISANETYAYNTLVKKTIHKHTSSDYNVLITNLHKNGELVYAQGYFDIPKEGKVNYDLILKNSSPTSLTINGEEYIK